MLITLTGIIRSKRSDMNLSIPLDRLLNMAYLQHINPYDTVANDYKLLDNIVPQLSPYKFLYFDEQLHILRQFKNRVDRFSFLQAMKLSVPINILRYDLGGGCESTVFLWQIPEERGLAEVMNMTMKVVERLKPRLPEYHSRRMRREFIQRYSTLQLYSKAYFKRKLLYCNFGFKC